MPGVPDVNAFRPLPPEPARGSVLEVLEFGPCRLGILGRKLGSALLIGLALAAALESRWALAIVTFAVGGLLAMDAVALAHDQARRVTVHSEGLLIDHRDGPLWVRWAEISSAEFRLAHAGGVLRFGPYTAVLPCPRGTALVEAIRHQHGPSSLHTA